MAHAIWYIRTQTDWHIEREREKERINCVHYGRFPWKQFESIQLFFIHHFDKWQHDDDVHCYDIGLFNNCLFFFFFALRSSHPTNETFDLASNPIMLHRYTIIASKSIISRWRRRRRQWNNAWKNIMIECARSSERLRVEKEEEENDDDDEQIGWNRIAKRQYYQRQRFYTRANWNICYQFVWCVLWLLLLLFFILSLFTFVKQPIPPFLGYT